MINAFRQLRLTNYNTVVTGTGILQVGTEQVVYRTQTGNFVSTAQTGQFYPASNPSGFITSAQAGGVQSLAVSGASVSGVITFTGINGVVVSTGVGSTIRIDGGNFITSAQTGQFYPITNPASFIRSGDADTKYALAGSTGSFITTAQTGQFIWTGAHQSFTTTVTTGIDNQVISYPSVFGTTPKVQVSIEVTGDIFYSVAVRNRNVSGYTAIFSDIIQESGVVLHTFATL